MAESDFITLRVVGIDWATEPKNRALVELYFDTLRRRIIIAQVTSPLSDDWVVRATRERALSVVAVDVPFGWPQSFVQFVGAWSPGDRTQDRQLPPREDFSYRTTDLVVQKTVGKWPLSVSSDRIALGAFAWAKLVERNGLHEQVDWGVGRAGQSGPTIIEVYPAATLAAWVKASDLVIDGYKKDQQVRTTLLGCLFERFNVDCSADDATKLASTGKDSDKTDAFIAALTALAYANEMGLSVSRPLPEQIDTARREGWIFFPK